jgi:hypothetical protein
MTKTLYASEEFPLLDVSSPEEEADFESISKPLINDDIGNETSFTYSKMLDVNITEKHPGRTKSSSRVRHAPKKYTPNSNKNKVYC